jgi:hypothetical protein
LGLIGVWDLLSEAVEGTTLSLQGINDIHGGDSLSLGVFTVSDGVANDIFKENLEYTSGLLVDETADSLDTTSTSQTTNGRFGYSLDVVSQNFSMSLCTSLAKTFASRTFSTTRHLQNEEKSEKIRQKQQKK